MFRNGIRYRVELHTLILESRRQIHEIKYFSDVVIGHISGRAGSRLLLQSHLSFPFVMFYLMLSCSFVFLSRLMSQANCEIRLYRCLIIAINLFSISLLLLPADVRRTILIRFVKCNLLSLGHPKTSNAIKLLTRLKWC